MCCTYRLDQRWYRDTVALCFPYGMQRAFCCFKWIQPLPGGLLQREKLYLLMFSRNLFVPDFVRRFFVSCAQISEAYVVRTLMKFGHSWRKIGHKGRCRKDSERTFICSPGIFLCRKGSGRTLIIFPCDPVIITLLHRSAG